MENWPDPPLLESLFLEDQVFYLVLALLAVAVVLYVVSGRRQMPGLRRATAVPVAAAVLAATVATLYETEREQMTRAAEAMVVDATTVPFDSEQLGLWLAPHFSMTAGSRTYDRKRVLSHAKQVLGSGGMTLRDYWVHDLEAHQEPGQSGSGLTYLFITVQSDGGIARTEWLLRWERDAQGRWMMAEAQLLKLNGQKPERIFSWF